MMTYLTRYAMIAVPSDSKPAPQLGPLVATCPPMGGTGGFGSVSPMILDLLRETAYVSDQRLLFPYISLLISKTLPFISSCTHVHKGQIPFVLTKRLVIPQARKASNAA
jgi:hypothetical protein